MKLKVHLHLVIIFIFDPCDYYLKLNSFKSLNHNQIKIMALAMEYKITPTRMADSMYEFQIIISQF
jgi:hypothetical protein